MSADNWTICPACRRRAEDDKRAATEEAKEAYGKVDADTYKKLLSASESSVKLDDTLREDYEIGFDGDEEFMVSYRASCDCGYVFTYKHSEQVPSI